MSRRSMKSFLRNAIGWKRLQIHNAYIGAKKCFGNSAYRSTSIDVLIQEFGNEIINCNSPCRQCFRKPILAKNANTIWKHFDMCVHLLHPCCNESASPFFRTINFWIEIWSCITCALIGSSSDANAIRPYITIYVWRDNIAMASRELFRALLHSIYDWCTNEECWISAPLCIIRPRSIQAIHQNWNHISFIYLEFLASCNIRLLPNSCKFRKQHLRETKALEKLKIHFLNTL